jgi:hypothetical protein
LELGRLSFLGLVAGRPVDELAPSGIRLALLTEFFVTAYDATLVERPRVLAGHSLQGIIEETFAVSGTPAYGALTRR